MLQLPYCYSDIKFCRGFVEPFSDDRGGSPPYIILCQVGFYGKVKRAIYLELAMKPTPNCYSCKITIIGGRLLSFVAVSYATLKVSVDF